MKQISIATLSTWDDTHRERARQAARRRKRTPKGDPHSQGTVLLMGAMTECPLCAEKMIRRRLNSHRRERHTK